MLPATIGMIGVMLPAGKKRALVFVAITCGKFALHVSAASELTIKEDLQEGLSVN
jgi:hypothetical protein